MSWTDSYKKVSKWFARYDLEEQLDQNGGIVQLTDFLPTNIAEGALEVLQQVPEVCLPIARMADYVRLLIFGNTLPVNMAPARRRAGIIQVLRMM